MGDHTATTYFSKAMRSFRTPSNIFILRVNSVRLATIAGSSVRYSAHLACASGCPSVFECLHSLYLRNLKLSQWSVTCERPTWMEQEL
jgi:hypothetical protein